MVCAAIFLGPALRTMLGVHAGEKPPLTACLGNDLGQNDERQDYLRARLDHGADGAPVATAFEKQDSSVFSGLAHADCLVVRAPFAAPAKAGESVTIIPLSGGILSI